jgi:hypothetical protein
VFDSLFRFLFKYPPLIFEQGDFALAVSRPVALGILAAAALAAGALLTYRGIASDGRARDRAILVALRLAALAVLVFCLFRPTLILKSAVPQQNFLGILLRRSAPERLRATAARRG